MVFQKKKVILLSFILGACMLLIVSAKPLENDSAEIVMKIEKVNGQLPAIQTKLKEASSDDGKKKKSQRNYPVYYVNTKVNGKFGKSVRAFTSEEFVDQFPVKS